MKGIQINNKKKLYFTRHAESYGNVGKGIIDSPLTENGIMQAKNLTGHYNCIICSPLRRAKETLHYSQITYNNLIINDAFSERIFGITDQMILDKKESEQDDEFHARVNKFHQLLEELCKHYDTILLIGHAYYFNFWYREGCFPSPPHAEIIELV